MKFTKSQKRAIEAQSTNLALSAGAGSGKTTVLVNRYINFLASKSVGIKEILAITFTNKSAADMRIKIREHISKQIKSYEGPKKKYWQNIKDQFEQATISTIHGFALQVLRSHPLESEVNPESTLMDEVEAKILLTDTIREIIREYYQDESMQTLVQTIKSVDNTINLLASIYQKIRSLGQLLEEATAKALKQHSSVKARVSEVKLEVRDLFNELKQIVDNYNKTSAFTTRYNQTNVSEIIKGLSEVETFQDSNFNFACKEVKTLLSRPIGDAKEVVLDIKEKVDEITNGLAFLDTLPLYRLLQDLLLEIDEKYSTNKKKQRLLDYSDLEWGLLKILRDNEKVRKHYQKKYKFVLVDEFQDTSPLQQELIRLLSPYDKNGMFIVGDSRQSIYRFRAAELAGFIKMREEIKEFGGEALYLAENFRSKPSLIEFQNDFFNYLFGQSDLEYQEVKPGINHEDKTPRVKLWYPHQEDITEEMNTNNLRQLEAKYIANNIKELKKQGVQYKDIAVLFRAMTNVKMYELALQEENIPYQVTGSRGLLDKQEIIDLLNLLKFFTDETNQIILFGLLRSPFYAFSDEELYRLRNDKALDKNLGESAKKKYEKVIDELSFWKQKLTLEKISDFLEGFVLEKNYKASLLVAKDYGKQAVANVNKFISLIRSLEGSNITSLSDILDYINVMRQGDALMGEAKVSEEINAVQIMSIHQSKGLEFDTVIIPQLERSLINSPKDMICYTKEYGLVVRTRGFSDNTQNNFYFDLMKESEKYLDLEEAYRLFYVATTRAENMLILSTASTKIGNKKGSYYDYLAEYLNLEEMPKNKIVVKDLVEVSPQKITESSTIKDNIESFTIPKTSLMDKIDFKSNTNLFLSATALMIHFECPKQYYFRYIKNVPEFRGKATKHYSASELGTIIHKVCEVMNDENGYELLEMLLSKVNKPDNVVNIYRVNGRKMIDNYVKSDEYNLIKNATKVQSELIFNLSISDKILTGVIDKFIIKKRKFVLIDLKTGIIDTKQLEKYKLQNAVYALAIYSAYKQYPSALINYYMSDSSSYDYFDQLPDYESSLALVENRLKALDKDLAKREFSKNLDSCKNCAYLNLCKKDKGDKNA
ncbi:MAG: UvrD-helicase domain-containing protein [Clostridia bacterium]